MTSSRPVRGSTAPWQQRAGRDGRLHGLGIVRALTADLGRDGDATAGWVVRARLARPAVVGQPLMLPRQGGVR